MARGDLPIPLVVPDYGRNHGLIVGFVHNDQVSSLIRRFDHYVVVIL